MKNSQEIYSGRHCVFNLKVHLVFLPKYRRKVFTVKIFDFLKNVFISICHDFECTLEEFNGEEDHIHVLISYPPKVQLSKLVNSLKGVSSRLLKKQNLPEIKSKLWGKHFWSPSYYAGSCGGVTIEHIKKYIDSQKSPNSSPP